MRITRAWRQFPSNYDSIAGRCSGGEGAIDGRTLDAFVYLSGGTDSATAGLDHSSVVSPYGDHNGQVNVMQ